MTNSSEITSRSWLDAVVWNDAGLVPAIAQDAVSGQVLMMAWMNRESLARTIAIGEAVYWSRSRNAIWHKGETSGHIQKIKEIRLDCDGDTVLLKVDQTGDIACHTGRKHCFFHLLEDNRWVVTEQIQPTPGATARFRE